jgi:hypothetical protein
MTKEILMDSEGRVTDIRDFKPTPQSTRALTLAKVLIFTWIAIGFAGFVCFLGDICSR